MRNFLCVWLLLITSSLFANSFMPIHGNDTLKESNIKQESKRKKKRDLKEKLIQMDGYIACNFTKLDEDKAIADGYVFQGEWSMKYLKEFIMKDRNVLPNAIFVISASGNYEFGEYEVCAGGIYYKYYSNKQDGYSRHR